MSAGQRVPSINWHLILTTLYLGQGLALFFFVSSQVVFNLDVTFLSHNFLTQEAHTTFRTIYALPLLWLLVATVGIAGLGHLYGGVRLHRRQPVAPVVRWLTLGIIYGLVLVATALLLGVADLGYLLLFMLSGLTFGIVCLLDESLQRQRATRKLYQSSTLLFKLVTILKEASGVVPWSLLFGHLLATMLWSNNVLSWTHYFICLLGLLLTGLSLFIVHFFRQAEADQLVYWHSGLSCLILSSWLWVIVLQIS